MKSLFSHRSLLFFCLYTLTTLSFLQAQEREPFTMDALNDPSLFQAFSVPRTWWLTDNTAFLFDPAKPAEERTIERFDPKSGNRTPAYDAQKAKESFKALFSEAEPPSLPPIPSEFTRDGRRGLYTINGDVFVLELSSNRVMRVTATPEEEESAGFSPDGNRIAYIRKNDLYAYDLASKKESRLTSNGSDTILNGSLSWVYWEEVAGRRNVGYWWSTDSKTIAFLRTDDSGVSIQHYVDITPWTPTVTKQRYPKVGEKNPEVKVGLADAATGTTVWVGLDPKTFEYVVRVDWLPGSSEVCIRTMNRLQTELDFWFVDRSTGKARHILKDTNEGWVNISDDLHFLNDGKHFLITSERDGYAHLYRFTMDGKLVNQITKGPWALSSSGTVYWVRKAISGIDEKNGWIYFTAQEKSSVEKHFYRIRFDGTGMKRLSEGDGTHVIAMSPNADYYFDRYSNISTPPSLVLYDASGAKKIMLAESNLGGFKKYDVQFGEILWIPARDGFKLPAWLLKPAKLEPGKKYPVVVSVYGGPSAPTVGNSFTGARWENVLLTNGYLSFYVDNRGATAISKTLENLFLKSTPGDMELNDLVDGVRWLKKLPFVDPDRIGITGWSGGGTNTILGMTRSTEFKAGIAGAGVTDFRFYDTKWAEGMMKTEKENLEGYEKASLLKDAKNLHGKLMLVHGTHDDNVHIQNTWRFVDELIKANKLFELMVYPLRKHGVGDRIGRIHFNNVQLDFWKRNL